MIQTRAVLLYAVAVTAVAFVLLYDRAAGDLSLASAVATCAVLLVVLVSGFEVIARARRRRASGTSVSAAQDASPTRRG